MAKPKPPVSKQKAKSEAQVKVRVAAQALRAANNGPRVLVAMDEAASALDGLFSLPEDLRGGSLHEVLAYLASEGEVSRSAAEAADTMLHISSYQDYDRPKIDLEQQAKLANALEALAGRAEE